MAQKKSVPRFDMFLENGWPRFLVFLHLIKIVAWFHRVDFFSGLPLVNTDYVQYYARALRAHEFLTRSHRIWGYDPFQNAGTVSGLYNEVGNYFVNLVCHVLSPFLPIARALLIVEIAGIFLAPFIIWAAVKNFSKDSRAAWASFALMVMGFGILERLSMANIWSALFGFQMGSLIAILQVSLFWRWLGNRNWANLVWLSVTTSLVIQIHPSSLIIFAIPNLFLFFYFLRSFRRQDAFQLGCALVFVFLSNYYWIRPFIEFSEWRAFTTFFQSEGLLGIFQLLRPGGTRPIDWARFVFQIMVILLSINTLRDRAMYPRGLKWGVMIWMAWLMLVTFWGSHIPWIDSLQPSRNIFPLWMVVYVVGAPSLSRLVRRNKFYASGAVALPVLCLILMAPMFGWINFLEPLTTTLPRKQQALIEFLKTQDHSDGRVMLEVLDHPREHHISDLIPKLTGQHVIGGPHPGNHMLTKFLVFTSLVVLFPGDTYEPQAFGKKMKYMSAREFSSYLALYNVKLVAAVTPRMAKHLFKLKEALEPFQVFEGNYIFKTRGHSTWFHEGSGEVTADYDKLTVSNASRGRMILKFHWLKTFRSHPPVPIKPVWILNDPLPFIEIDNSAGFSRFDIVNNGY